VIPHVTIRISEIQNPVSYPGSCLDIQNRERYSRRYPDIQNPTDMSHLIFIFKIRAVLSESEYYVDIRKKTIQTDNYPLQTVRCSNNVCTIYNKTKSAHVMLLL
jgi:hypothetical protein